MTWPVETPNAAAFAALRGAIQNTDINIVGMGDSHTEGKLKSAAANDASAPVVHSLPVLGPRDKTWGGSALDAYYRIARRLGSAATPSASNDAGFSAVGTDGSGSWLQFLPSILRAGYPKLRNIAIANVAVGGSSAYTWAGECAYGLFRGITNANDGDTITAAGQVYTFRTTPAANYDVTIGAAVANTITNLANAINGEGSGFFAGTPAHTSLWAYVSAGNCRTYALASGAAANSQVALSSNTTRISAVNDANVAATSVSYTGGSATSAVYSNAKSKLVGFTPDVITITIGTNDANRAGLRGRNTQSELTKWIDNLHADFPSAKIVIARPPVLSSGAASLTALTNVVLPAIDAVVAANSSFVSSVDMNGVTAGVAGEQSQILNTTDGIHLTPYGYFVEAQLFAAGIGTALGLAS